MSVQLLIILVPLIFGLMGFAIDLGRLYLVKAELANTTNAMALAAARQLIGTATAIDNATAAAEQTLNDSSGHANKFNFGSLIVGQSTGLLASQIDESTYFTTAGAATGADTTTTDSADGTTARHVQVNVSAEAPLLFWSLLSLGQARKTTIASRAVAGISAPVCTACSTEPIAVAALSTDDTTDFGFTAGTQYTFAANCTNQPGVGGGGLPGQQNSPQPFTGTGQVVSYAIVDRDKVSTLELPQQLYRFGAGGLIASSIRTQSCLTIGDTVILWTDPDSGAALTPQACSNITPPAGVQQMLCGMNVRLDAAVPETCSANVTDAEAIAPTYTQDTDLNTREDNDYTQYTGNGRRVLTLAIVDLLVTNGTDTMTILGFRQFLVMPNTDGLIPFNDQWGRFSALYIGSIVPVSQGYVGDRFATGCSITTGPGKVVLHQ
jgi:Flp pilus assembly protein TadG